MTYSRISQVAFRNRLEESGFANVGKSHLILPSATRARFAARNRMPYNAALEAVPGPAQKNLLLLDYFLGGHLAVFRLLAMAAKGDMGSSAFKLETI